jgi:hypothetical protein
MSLAPNTIIDGPQMTELIGDKMNAQKFFSMKSIILIVSLLVFVFGFEVIKVETISGVVEKINQDSKSIVVDKAKIFVSVDTKIVNPDHSVEIEGVKRSGNFSATKILVKAPRKRP